MKRARVVLFLLVLMSVSMIMASCFGGEHTHYYKYTVTTEATCESEGLKYGLCSCGDKFYETMPALGHQYSTPTCVKSEECLICGKVASPALGHDEKILPAVEATCTKSGLTEGSMCVTCGEVLVAQEEIPATGHNLVNYDGKQATCLESGWQAYDVCSKCDYSSYKEIPATGHSGGKATCVDKAVCDNCGSTYGDYMPHSVVNDSAVAPTCTESGITEGRHCHVCSAVLVAQSVIPALGHTEVIDEGIPATCTKSGITEGKHCSTCNKVFVNQQIIPALGHTVVVDEAKAATCTATGLTEGKHCSACKTVLVAQEVIKALGHKEVLVEGFPATCTESGLTEGKHCSTCGEVLVAQEEIPTLGHKGGVATSTNRAVCSVCGEEYGDIIGSFTYKIYTSVSPSNWNELTYQDNNDTQIMSYLGSPFFESDFKFDAEGNILPGQFDVEYSFATALEDITSQYVGQYGIKEGDTSLVWKITIRNDGKWQNGDPIVAGDFVYTMKEQLNPLFLNYRADSFYNGSVNIYGARNYVYQGQTVTESATTKYTEWNDEAKADSSLYFSIANAKSYIGSWIKSNYGDYEEQGWLWVWWALSGVDCTPLEGKTWAEISASSELTAIWEASLAEWQTEPNEELHFFCHDYTYPSYSWDNVGMWAPSDTEIVVCLTQGIELLDADGNLTYHCFYEFSSLPLVHKATYEANKVEPAIEGGLWTSTYNSSLESTMSWGPYKLTQFQAGKFYVLEKNDNWYGYKMEKYEGQYETTRIECETITSYETAFLKFLSGDLTGIGIDVAKAPTYKNSERAYYTPDDYVGSMQLQSDKAALKSREEGVNKTLLSYRDFRKAISLSFDRLAYTQTCTTASLPGFGIFNSMHYYDVEDGGVYRNTDIAKQVLCDVYGVDVNDYFDLEEAYDAITGYDLEQARELLETAYEAALAAGDIKATDKVVLTYGSSVDSEAVRRNYNFIKASLENLAVGTVLEGRLTCEFDSSFGSKWADDFRAGAYDICQGGWTGAAWNPGYFLMAYLSPDYMFSSAWATDTHDVTITVPGVKLVDGKYVITNNASDSYTNTLPLYDEKVYEGYNTNWYQLLNNEFAEGVLNNEFRLVIISALEKAILGEYYTVPVSYNFSASLISYQVDYVTYEYNTFMEYGGIRYMTYNYNDADWQEIKGNYDYTK